MISFFKMLGSKCAPGFLLMMLCGATACGGSSSTSPGPVVLVALEQLPAEIEITSEPGSVRFDWAFAQANEHVASVASIFTGIYASAHGVSAAGGSLAEGVPTLAEAFARAGRPTGIWWQGAIPGELDRGFGEIAVGQRLAEAAEWAEGFAGRHADSSFLLVVVGTAGDNGTSALVERLRTALTEVSHSQRATMAVVGTIGSIPAADAPLALRTVHVPLLLDLPQSGEPVREDRVVEALDLMPTLLELAGLRVPERLQGASLMPIIGGSSRPPYAAFGEDPANGELFVTLGGLRLVTGPARSAQLTKLPPDPSDDETPVPDAEASDRKRALQEYADAWAAMVRTSSGAESGEQLDPQTLERLRSLGYIQ